MSEINVLQRTQTIVVDSSTGTVSVINAGPQGPAGTAVDLTARASAATALSNSEDALELAEGAVQSIIEGTNVEIDNTDPNNPIINVTAVGGGAVDSVNGQTGVVVLTHTSVGAASTTDPRLSDARTPTAHNQAISTITGLQTALDSKAAAGGLADHIAATTAAHGGIVPQARTVTAGEGLAGGGDLSANRTISLSPETIASLDNAVQTEDLASLAVVYIHDGESYALGSGRIFIGDEDPVDDGFTMGVGDSWFYPSGSGGGGGGGGAVDSVNGQTGVVSLDAADVDAVPLTRTISVGPGLSGGGDLSADRTISVIPYIMMFDAGGSAATARPDVSVDVIVVWRNTPSEPVNLGPNDMWEDIS